MIERDCPLKNLLERKEGVEGNSAKNSKMLILSHKGSNFTVGPRGSGGYPARIKRKTKTRKGIQKGKKRKKII